MLEQENLRKQNYKDKLNITIENDGKFVLLHNFSNKEMIQILRAVKSVIDDHKSIAFATTTQHNLYAPLKKLISDARSDHQYLLENPPQKPKL